MFDAYLIFKLMYLLQINEVNVLQNCIDCALKGSKREIAICLVTLVAGVVIRHFEKKRILRKEKGKNQSEN